MGFLNKVWAFLNGKKTAIGAIVTFLGVLALQLPSLLGAFGVEDAKIAVVVGVITTVIGLIHKAWKWIFREDFPEPK